MCAMSPALKWNTQRLKFLRQPSDADTQNHASATKIINRSDGLGQHKRIMLRNQANPGSEPNPAGTGGGERQRRKRIVYRDVGRRQKFAARGDGIWIMRVVTVEQDNMLRRPHG